MYIIDKNKDYYDYLSHIYGIDKQIVFDRRGSTVATDEKIVYLLENYKYRKSESFVLLEVGNTQYVFKIYDIQFEKSDIYYEQFKSCKIEYFHIYRNNKHYYNSIMSLREIVFKYNWLSNGWRRVSKNFGYNITNNFKNDIARENDKVIDLPILANTSITSLIKPEEIWIELQTYISSLKNDKNIDIKLSDVDKAVNHGFDKYSFRHPIK